MHYTVTTDYDHGEQHNCRKPETYGQELPEISYCITVKYATEAQKDEIVATIEKVFAEHLAEETKRNMRHISPLEE